MQTSDRQVVFTNKARCRDCYRCVRVCPVKAIRMHDGQANVVDERCIGCGTCVRECPQGAKSFRNDLERVLRLIQDGRRVAASIAPSFAAVFAPWQRQRLVSALRRLGFFYVGETAIGAYDVAKQTAEVVQSQPHRPWICTACPAVVRYVERYRPQTITSLIPVVSPMVAHAKHIRRQFGNDVKVVFIGPCVAKKAEAERPELFGLVEEVLTFHELAEWFDRTGIDLSACEESDFDEVPEGDARLFPLEGGCVRTAGWSADVLSGDVTVVSGFEEFTTAFDGLEPGVARVIEPLFCHQGCINGPGMDVARNLFARRGDVLDYAAEHPGKTPQKGCDFKLATGFAPCGGERELTFSEEDIRRVLEMTGKSREEDQLNCGACGYASCLEKAVAVLRGMAEPEMCIPHMKRLAEQRVDRIIDTSPNGIVVLDDQLRILNMNPAFKRFFTCSEAVHGQPISYLMDPEPFERLATGQENVIEITAEHAKYNLVAHQIMYCLREERQFVGIFVNITHSRKNQQQLDRIRSQTVVQARELLEHQIQMAENIVCFLGESTAKSEDLVEKLMVLADESHSEESGGNGDGSNRWLKDTYAK